MKKFKKDSAFYVLCGITTLICGLFVYLIFRPNTYVTKFIFGIIPLEPAMTVKPEWLKYYAGDFLWAFSLSCFIYAIYLPNIKRGLGCSGIVAFVGLSYELMQYFKVVPGTGDIVDVLFYLLAAIAVNIINYLRRKKDDKQKNY